MSLILSIESGTAICSVGLFRDGEMLSLRESVEGRDHARMVATFADEIMKEMGVTPADLSAVAVSKGPGSYTGLRIGVSFAKGLCYGAKIPLVGVGSLDALVANAIEQERLEELAIDRDVWRGARLLPMIDARRMEVYTQLFNTSREAEGEVEAKVIDEGSYSDLHSDASRAVILFGDGATKCADVLGWAHYVDVAPSAFGVAKVAEERLQRGEVEDVAYFEPLYLKDAAVTVSKRKYF